MGPTLSLRAAIAVTIAATLVSACDRQSTAEMKRSAENAGQKIDNALDRTGQKISEASEKAVATVKDAAAMGDTAITASVKTDFLKDPDLSVLKIDVDTRDGVVTLNGLADNDEARLRAEKLASAVKGVREVRNFLTVKHA